MSCRRPGVPKAQVRAMVAVGQPLAMVAPQVEPAGWEAQCSVIPSDEKVETLGSRGR